MNRKQIMQGWSLAVGAMDACTGLLLIFIPAQVMAMLHIEGVAPEAMVFLSWVGVFVLAVGLSYGFALVGRRGWGEVTWLITATVRTLVALFISSRILSGALEATWATVALCDALVAAVQFVILRKAWWREVEL